MRVRLVLRKDGADVHLRVSEESGPFYVFHTVREPRREAVHLPQVPHHLIRQLSQGLGARGFPPAGFVVLRKGFQKVHPCDKETVSLVLVAIGSLEGPERPAGPVFLIFREGRHHMELSIQYPRAFPGRDHLSRRRVVALGEIRRFAAGDFQPLVVHIFLPGFLRPGEKDIHMMPGILRQRFKAEEVAVDGVDHLIAHPPGRENFAMLLRPARLLLQSLPRPGFDDTPILIEEERDFHFPPLPIPLAPLAVRVSPPEDAPLRGLVRQELSQEPPLRELDHIVLYIHQHERHRLLSFLILAFFGKKVPVGRMMVG